jgi:hypothetical protein
METKVCNYCNFEKPIDSFTKGKARCKLCLASIKKVKYKENPELYNFTNNLWYKNSSITDNSTIHNPKYKNVNRNQLWPTQNLNLPFNSLYANGLLDINEKSRSSNVNLGAYQTIP